MGEKLINGTPSEKKSGTPSEKKSKLNTNRNLILEMAPDAKKTNLK